MPRKLKDIDVLKIALCDAAANRKKFYIQKEETMDELIKLLKEYLGENSITEEDIAKAKELDEESIKAIKGALNILKKYDDHFTDELKDAVKTLTKYASYGYPAKKSDDDDENVMKLDVRNMTDEDLEKAGKYLSKANIEQLKKALDIIRNLVAEKEKDVKKGHDNLPDDVVKELEEARRMKKEAREKEEEEKLKKEKERDETIKALKEEVEKLKKKKGVKKGIEGPKGDDKGDDKGNDEPEDPYPSIKLGNEDEED